MAIISARDVSWGLGSSQLLRNINLQIEPGERIGLLGRNGAGKTTLLRLLHGSLAPDGGEVLHQQGIRIGYLPQTVPELTNGTVFDVAAAGLGQLGRDLAEYHHLNQIYSLTGSAEVLEKMTELQQGMQDEAAWDAHRQIDTAISRLGLTPDVHVNTLSAGWKRRLLLAQALVGQPDLLLLDEPTNHLDLSAIIWLESFLLQQTSSLLFVTHDRALLRKLATRIVELDRTQLSNWACDYPTYLARKEAQLVTEADQAQQLDKKIAIESEWAHRGVKARRTRNEGRVRALQRLREERSNQRKQVGAVRIQLNEAERNGKLVIEAEEVSHTFGGPHILHGFSTTILRGDKVGIMGPNGAGKTTLLRVLLGELKPSAGWVRHGTKLEVAYFDQLRLQLDESRTLADNVSNGQEWLLIDGKRRHIISYLADFLFTPEQAKNTISRLSGGERNRLLLARLFLKPSNLLVLDEPTNDLDLETVELLEDLLFDYKGTVLAVSHDRTFLNNVVTSTLVFEGDGRVAEYAGGYDDWLTQRPQPRAPETPAKVKAKPQIRETSARPKRLTYLEQRELEGLPVKIENLESEVAALFEHMGSPSFYRQNSADITQAQQRLATVQRDIEASYARWEELEQIKQDSGR